MHLIGPADVQFRDALFAFGHYQWFLRLFCDCVKSGAVVPRDPARWPTCLFVSAKGLSGDRLVRFSPEMNCAARG
jgi:hypothetical protein